MKITSEEKELRTKRRDELNKLIKKHNIKTGKLASVSGLSDGAISNFKSGKSDITEENWKTLTSGIDLIIEENKVTPNIEVEDWDYVVKQLKLNRNVWINKNKIKNIDQYMLDLKLNGFDCSYTTDSDGGYIINSVDMFKPMVEKVIQAPKPVIVSDPSIIAKVRNLHADSIVLHDEAIKLQESTEQILKESTFDSDKPEYKMPEYAPGCSVTSAFGLEVEPIDEILITHEEIKGFIRGITILSVLDEDYQKASYFIDYFMNNGYVQEEA